MEVSAGRSEALPRFRAATAQNYVAEERGEAKKLVSRFKQDDEGVTGEQSKAVTSDDQAGANFPPDL